MMDTTQNNRRVPLICLVLALASLAVFWQVSGHEFVNYDDNEYVTENPHVQAGLTLPGITWAFTTSHAANWHPLTWISHMLDCRLFGLNPSGHHLVNLLFHSANTLLLFLVLHRMTQALWRSAFAAALFALHPLHVESVAWVAERKEVLGAFFWMLTMGAYVRYAEHPGIRRYIPVLLFFILGLMSKPMLVTLPFVLLLLDYWPLGRLHSPKKDAAAFPRESGGKKRKAGRGSGQGTVPQGQQAFPHQWPVLRALVWEKMPLFAFSAASSVMTFYAQQKEGAMSSLHFLPLDTRIGNALVSYATYMAGMIWPRNLAIFYPYPAEQPLWQVAGAALILVTITILVIGGAKRYPCLLTGWFWFLGTLVPVIGLVQVGRQAMADRYTYIPLIGLFLMIAWGAPELLKKWRFSKVTAAALAGAVLAAFTIVTLTQLRHWQDSITLFRHAIRVTADNDVAHSNLGFALFRKGHAEEAIAHYREAITINPNFGEAHKHLGKALFMRGEIGAAELHIREAIRINPGDAETHYNLGVLLSSQGRTGEAIDHLRAALKFRPDFAQARYDLGNILASQGMLAEAIVHFAEVLRLEPNNEKAHNNMGRALLAQGRIDDAIAQFRSALHLKPDSALAGANLREALSLQQKKQ